MKRFFQVFFSVSLIGLLAVLVSMVAGDLMHPETWGVVGHRDPRMYVPALTVLAFVVVWMFLQAWLNDRRFTSKKGTVNESSS
jgi:hypothetical protein